MNPWIGRPSFWMEVRDPWAWQRALRKLAGMIPDPTPCWENELRGVLSRNAVAGLYGWKAKPAPGTLLGVGFLQAEEQGWVLRTDARVIVEASRDEFPSLLADWLLRRSFWLRLAVRRLGEGRWKLPYGVGPLQNGRIRVDTDLVPDPHDLNGSHAVRLGPWAPERGGVKMERAALGALQAPLYLLWSLGLLTEEGRPQLPAEIADELMPATAAATLRRITREEADLSGFSPFERVACRLAWEWLETEGGREWSDRIFSRAFETGTIEVQEWAPGQPRHGRGFLGDRSRKRVRWTIHDDFTLPGRKELCG